MVTTYIRAETELASRSLMIFMACGMKLAMEQPAAATPTALMAISGVDKAPLRPNRFA
jgi:hypothetical protein